MNHYTTPEFWQQYNALPQNVRALANKAFGLLKSNPNHPSLHFKKVESLWSARIGQHYRALGFERDEGIVWIWIGSHADYDSLLR